MYFIQQLEAINRSMNDVKAHYDMFSARANLDQKIALFKLIIDDFRRTHSVSASEVDYYGRVALESITSWAKVHNVLIAKAFDANDPMILVFLSRTSKNDNLSLRAFAYFFLYVPYQQLEQYDVWRQPLDLV